MNRKMVFYTVGMIALLEAALMLPSLGVGLIYGEGKSVTSFLVAIVVAAAAGGLMMLLFRPKSRVIYAKEGLPLPPLPGLR